MPFSRGILPLVFLSGLAALVHEVVWLRLFSLTFGNTAQAGAVVLGSFMGGLALGAWFFGRRAERSPRPWRLYGRLELGVAASAAVLLAGYLAADSLYAAVFRIAGPESPALGVVRLLSSLALMAAPCALMGGTLPVLVHAAAPAPDASGRQAGAFYAVNTLGAVFGVAAAGFLTIRWWGVWPTAWAAVGLNAAVGLATLALCRREAPRPAAAAAPAAPPTGERRGALGLAAALGGYALALEVLYSRIIVFAVYHTIYIWTVILAVYLAGLAFGSALTARASQRRATSLDGAACCLIGMAICAWAYLAGISWLAKQFFAALAYLGDGGVKHALELQMAFAALTIFPPAAFSGAAFPFLVRGCVGPKQMAGACTGALYAVNTGAGVVGSLAAGFVLLPAFGPQWSLFGLTALFFVAAGAALLRTVPRRRAVAWLAAGFLAALPAALLPGPRLLSNLLATRFPSDIRVLMSADDVAATVSVIQRADKRLVVVNNTPVAGAGAIALRNTQVLQGCYPLAAHPHPRRVAMIGFGSGETADIIAQARPEVFDLAELCPGVFAAAAHFHDINFGIERAALPRRLIMDGKNYLRFTAQKYDVVMNDCIHPAYVGSGSLYCRDHFEAGRRALDENGVMTSWLPIYQLDLQSVRSIVRTFATVFPNCGIVYAPTHFNFHALLIGKKQPGPLFSLARVQELLARPDLKDRLAQIEVDDPLDLLNFLLVGPQGIAARFSDAPLISDNHPILEFEAGRMPPQDIAAFWRNAAHLASLEEDPLPYVDLAGTTDLDSLLAAQPARRRATRAMLRLIGDNEIYPARAALLVDEAAAASPGLAGVVAMKQDIVQNGLRGRPAPTPAGAGRRQEQVEARLRAGDLDGAAKDLEAELDRNPADFKALLTLAKVRVQQGDLAGGARRLEQALRVHPGDALAMWRLGEIAARRGDWRQAEQRLRATLERFGPAASLYSELAQVREAVGDATGALGWLREGLSRFPDDRSLLAAYADALQATGQTELAAQARRRAAELSSTGQGATEAALRPNGLLGL